ncbi:hypothetical protein JXJ21_07710 [candidate division KSB1 bacterium]|nr:hypothetical protein [candidate division KSB1 bacterium]
MNIMKIAIILISCFLLQSSLFSQPDLKYQERGNRYEGVELLGVRAPDLELISFMGYQEETPPNTDVILKLKFYIPADAKFFITAKELVYRRSYLMKPLTTDWQKGWRIFEPWPTHDVINQLELKVDEIGVVGRLNYDRLGSGQIAPLILYHTKPISRIDQYAFRLRAKRTLSYVNFALSKAGEEQPIESGILREPLPAMEPFRIGLDFSDKATGEYTLTINCRIKNEWGGPNRTYTFYHNPVVK